MKVNKLDGIIAKNRVTFATYINQNNKNLNLKKEQGLISARKQAGNRNVNIFKFGGYSQKTDNL